MLSGRRLDLLDPSPLDIEIEDIAHGLARVARWNGQTRGDHIFSVAQHTLLVEEVARRRTGTIDSRLGLAILLHDAPEYVIGDMISPFKAVIGGAYRAVERRLLVAIHLRFALPPELPSEILSLIKAASGTFTLTFSGQTTGAITYSTTPATTATNVQAALAKSAT